MAAESTNQKCAKIKSQMSSIENQVSIALKSMGFSLDGDFKSDSEYWDNVTKYTNKEQELKDDMGYYKLVDTLKSLTVISAD